MRNGMRISMVYDWKTIKHPALTDLKGVSLDMGKNCTVSLFFEQAALSQQGVLPRYTVSGVDLV